MVDKEYVIDADYFSSFAVVVRLDLMYLLLQSKIALLAEVDKELHDGKGVFFGKVVDSEKQRGNIVYYEMPATSQEAIEFFRIRQTLGVGKGEAAVMAYCKNHSERVVCSNNLNDIASFCRKENIPFLTTSMHMIHLLDDFGISRGSLDEVWNDMIAAGVKLRYRLFDEALRNRSEVFCGF